MVLEPQWEPTRRTRRTRRTHRTLCGGGVWGRILTVGYPAYAGVPIGFALVPKAGIAEASASTTVSLIPRMSITNYMSWAATKHLMCKCFPHAAQT